MTAAHLCGHAARPQSPHLSAVHLWVSVDFVDDLVARYIFHLSVAASYKSSLSRLSLSTHPFPFFQSFSIFLLYF